MVTQLTALTSRIIEARSMDELIPARTSARDQSAPTARQPSRNDEANESQSAAPPKVVSARIKRLMKADY